MQAVRAVARESARGWWFSAQLAGDPRARGGVAEALGADGDERRAGVEQVARVSRVLTPPMPTTGNRDAGGDGRDLGEGDRADRGARQAAGAPAEPGRERRGRSARRERLARSVLISDTASAPPSCARARAGGDVGGVRRQLDDQRLARRADARREDGSRAGRVGADVEAGRDVRARDVELDRRDLGARLAACDELATSAAVEPMTFVISGTGSARSERRQLLGEVARRGPCSAGRSS